MKRDWWKIRHVLLEARAGRVITASKDELPYNLDLCRQAGFLRGAELTWEGQDAAALLEDADALQEVLAELEPVGVPWEVLRAALIRKRWPERPPLFEDLHYKPIPQTKLCPLCGGSGREPADDSTAGATLPCPHCHGARVIKE